MTFARRLGALFAAIATSTAYAELMPGEPPITEGATSFIVLPDTQNYSERFPTTYDLQTQWIVQEKDRRNIACALHLGDITNRNSPPEWEVAQRAMTTLDGHVPYFLAVGNHDYGPRGDCSTRDTHFDEYFPLSKYKKTDTFGGVYDKAPDRFDNSFHLFEAAGRKWIVLSLEFGPRKDVVRWANEVVAAHPDRSAILITHAYIFFDGTRYDWKSRGKKQAWNPYAYGVAKLDGGVSDGEDLWRDLVSKHPNFALVINGHVLGDGLGYMVSKGAAGQQIPQMLVNFQMKANGGDGWLRILEIQPDGKTVRTYDYSPLLKMRNTSPDNQFEFSLPDPPAG